MWTSRLTDFRSRDIAKNNFSGIDISQGLDLEPPSLSPYFLLLEVMTNVLIIQMECVTGFNKIYVRVSGIKRLIYIPVG